LPLYVELGGQNTLKISMIYSSLKAMATVYCRAVPCRVTACADNLPAWATCDANRWPNGQKAMPRSTPHHDGNASRRADLPTGLHGCQHAPGRGNGDNLDARPANEVQFAPSRIADQPSSVTQNSAAKRSGGFDVAKGHIPGDIELAFDLRFQRQIAGRCQWPHRP
jgi:hypothetical protein